VDLLAISLRVASDEDAPDTGVVKKTPGKGYCVKSEKNPDWSGGCAPTKGEAKKRLKQVEFFKHKGAVAAGKDDAYWEALEAKLWALSETHPDHGKEDFDEYVSEFFRSSPLENWEDEEHFWEYLDVFSERPNYEA
jgi:hypothetical protein